MQKVLPATISLFSTKSGASGSGVVVSKDGLILTAGHVVRGSDEMTVVFPNGKQATGKVLGANYTRDTAMVQIMDPKPTFGWPHAGIGKSQKLASGDLVIALGHAGGYDPVRTPPVRFGRVIAQGQDHFLNTDCTLIGGDSGGPLFDLNGSVVGIHSSIGDSLSSNNHAGITGVLQDWEKLKKGETWGSLGGSSLLDNPDAPVIGIITGRPSKSFVPVLASDTFLRAGQQARLGCGQETSLTTSMIKTFPIFVPSTSSSHNMNRAKPSTFTLFEAEIGSLESSPWVAVATSSPMRNANHQGVTDRPAHRQS